MWKVWLQDCEWTEFTELVTGVVLAEDLKQKVKYHCTLQYISAHLLMSDVSTINPLVVIIINFIFSCILF